MDYYPIGIWLRLEVLLLDASMFGGVVRGRVISDGGDNIVS